MLAEECLDIGTPEALAHAVRRYAGPDRPG